MEPRAMLGRNLDGGWREQAIAKTHKHTRAHTVTP